ncbi:MAG: PQQ-binding-like beta-propeller repeat protein, partial [candidate division Zixibacteria bacterium]|nr:PQQ-binding-like beta-propeller repeat protein [candidate division Zixibacteria bacterium]
MPTGNVLHRRMQRYSAVALLRTVLLVIGTCCVLPCTAAQAASAPIPIDPADLVGFQPLVQESALDCEWLSYHNNATFYILDNGDLDETDFFTLFTPDIDCTLKTARVYVYTQVCTGTPTLRLRVYGAQWHLYEGDPYPDTATLPPGTGPNLLGEIDVPWDSLVSGWNTIDLTGLPGWPGDYLFGALGTPFFLSVSLSPNTPNPGTDQIAFVIDGGFGDHHSGAYFTDRYWYFESYYGIDYGLLLQAEVCYYYVPPGPCDSDDWATWGHDYNRSCRSLVPVFQPCATRAVWTVDLPDLNSFCEPTIADGRVYISTDTRFDVYELATGTLINSVAAGPPYYIIDHNRTNATVANGHVFLTGGNAQSISMWDADLTAAIWFNGLAAGGGPLGADVRFGVTAVYEIAGTEVVVVGTEGGDLWCFQTSDGGLYSGWADNPVTIGGRIYHSPAYDGDDLYVATVGTDSQDGAIYRIDAATGGIQWTWQSSVPGQGYPSGLSLDGDYIYAASAEAATEFGHRVKLNKNGTLVWQYAQSRSLYGPPAYDQGYLYIPQDGAYPGVYMVDKFIGNIIYNFGVDGIGPVPQHVTLSCDRFMFSGDRHGRWWLTHIDTRESIVLYQTEYSSIVNGTALASDSATGNYYAVVSIRSGNPSNGGGRLLAFQMMTGARPRVVQNVPNVDIFVPFGAPASNNHVEPDLLSNIGCADLEITSRNVYDPFPDPTALAYQETFSRYAAQTAAAAVGDDYLSWFDDSNTDKMAGYYRGFVDEELTRGDVELQQLSEAMHTSKRQ